MAISSARATVVWILFQVSLLPYRIQADHLDSSDSAHPIIPGARTTYHPFEMGEDLFQDGAAHYCEGHFFRLARIRDYSLLPQIYYHLTEYTWVDGVSAPGDIYFRFSNGELAPEPNRILSENGVSVTYGQAYDLVLYDVYVYAYRYGTLETEEIVCEEPYLNPCPEVDCGYTTNEPFSHWNVVASDQAMTYIEAKDYCESIPNGEMLPIYTKMDREWVLSQLSDDGLFIQPLVEDPFDNNYRWPGRWALLTGTNSLAPFVISDDEVIIRSSEDSDYEYLLFNHKQVLVWNSATNMATLEDISEYSARALCKVSAIGENDCVPNPCENAGTCVDEIGGYTCHCYPGFTGEHCETDVNDCGSNSCYNGGTCIDGLNDFVCRCTPGHTGARCDSEIEEDSVEVSYCDSYPCRNGGLCIEGAFGYSCNCGPGYIGNNCEQLPACSTRPCQNGGACFDQPGGSFVCLCPETHAGPQCQTSVSACRTGTPCVNEGICVDQTGSPGYRCLCGSGYTGEHCEIAPTPAPQCSCLNQGTCYEIYGLVSCRCLPGFSGAICEVSDAEASLSMGAIVGIAVGCVVGLLMLMFLAVYCLRSQPPSVYPAAAPPMMQPPQNPFYGRPPIRRPFSKAMMPYPSRRPMFWP